MKIAEAFLKGKIDRFEVMELARIVSDLNLKGEHLPSFDAIDFCADVHFKVLSTVHVKKKEVLQYLSMLVTAVFAVANKRLASIFLNHYLACQNNTDFYKYLPRSRRKAFVIACGGLSGSGKSRVAREVAPELGAPLGAIVIRDDIVRKQLAGVDFDTLLGKEFYTPENERLVYKEMRRQAKQALLAGYPVVLDALFYSPNERKKAKDLAKKMGVSFDGFWMEAPLMTRVRRVKERKNNPSDMKDEADLLDQLSQDVGDVDWRYIYTSGAKEETLNKVRSFLKKYL